MSAHSRGELLEAAAILAAPLIGRNVPTGVAGAIDAADIFYAVLQALVDRQPKRPAMTISDEVLGEAEFGDD